MNIFYCAGENFGEVTGVFFTKKHSPDAGVGSTGRCTRESGALSAAGVGVECAPDASTGRGQDTVRASGGA